MSFDPDIAVLIEREIAISRKTFRAVVNEKLRRGFGVRGEAEAGRASLLPEPLDLGRPKVQNLDDIAEILELAAEDSR